MSYNDWLAHHGIKGMKWGKMQGPPYPLTDIQRSPEENKQNSTSPSAMALMRKGVNSRFNKTGATNGSYSKTNPGSKGSGGGSSIKESNDSKKQPVDNQSSERSEGKTYHDTLTRENRMKMLLKNDPDRYNSIKVKAQSSSGSGKSSSKSSKSSKKDKTEEELAKQKQKEEAAKQKEEAAKQKEEAAREKAEIKARDQWVKNGKKAVDDAFNNETNVRSFKDLLDEFYDGSFSKNFKGESDSELEDLLDDAGNKVNRSEGEEFYEKLLSRLDKDSSEYESFKEKYDEIMNDSESTSIRRLSRSISLLTDYADSLEKKDRSEDNKAYTKILGYLDDKLKWYSENKTSNRNGKTTSGGISAYEEIEEYLKKHGF